MVTSPKKTEKCNNCGAEVRPDTDFCYNCGKPVGSGAKMANISEQLVAEPRDKGLDALEKALEASRSDSGAREKLESAAAERKRSRGGKRRKIEVVWEPTSPSKSYFVVALVVLVITLAVVFLLRTVK